MELSTAQAAEELGVSARQVRRAVQNGRLRSERVGGAYTVPTRQVQVMRRTAHRGRAWSEVTCYAALDLLTRGTTNTISGSERSRLRRRVRTATISTISGQILRDRVSLRRSPHATRKRSFSPSILHELDLSADGRLGIIVARQANVVARHHHLALDDAGDIVVIEGDDEHRPALEALALYAYGDTRESSAAQAWLTAAQERL